MRQWISISLVLLFVGSAAAEEPAKPDAPPPPPPTEAPKPVTEGNPFDAYTGANPEGRALFDAAKQLNRDGDQKSACAKFAEGWSKEEAVSTQLNLARCRENEGKYGEAYRMFEDAAARSRKSGFEERAKIASDAAAGLDDKLATIVIRLQAPVALGTVVSVNDRVLDTAAEARERVDPGTVVVTAKGPTGVTSTKTFRVFARNTINVDVPPLHEREAGRKPVWIVASVVLVAGGAIAVGAGSGAIQLVGGVAIAGGVAMFLLAPRDRVMLVPMVTTNASGGGVALVGRF